MAVHHLLEKIVYYVVKAQAGVFGRVDAHAGLQDGVAGEPLLDFANAQLVVLAEVCAEAGVELFDDLRKWLKLFEREIKVFRAANRLKLVGAALKYDFSLAGLLHAVGCDGDILLNFDGELIAPGWQLAQEEAGKLVEFLEVGGSPG